jgi:hypothetical protein
VEQSLRALERGDAIEPIDTDAPAHGASVEGLVQLLSNGSAVRLERMVDARMRLAAGMQPTDDDLASRMVGRLVCDRLR